MRQRYFIAVVVLMTMAGQLHAQQPVTTDSGVPVPEAKQTQLKLYATSKEAYAAWQADPEKVKILDVRTPEEYAFVGHAPMAWNVPLMVIVHEWSADRSKLVMKPNPDFMGQLKKIIEPSDTVLVMCRSGGRSKRTVDLLAGEGFKNVYNIIDGFEGDAVKDPESVFAGKRLKNGWRNSGLPWTYKINADIVRLPKQP